MTKSEKSAKNVVATGRTVEEAIRAGLELLNADRERVRIKVLEEPTKGFLGFIGSKSARVELELIPDPVEEALDFLREVLDAIGIDGTLNVEDGGQEILIRISGSRDMGLIIGRRGQALDALQFLTNLAANRKTASPKRIVLDAAQFRERRREALVRLSERMAERVWKTRKEIVLEPMSPADRKIVHTHLQHHPAVRTYSTGEEPNRRVVISPKV